MTALARCPSLEDYDGRTARVFWAQDIASHALAPYDRPYASDNSPPEKTSAEVKADARAAAASALERWTAYQNQMAAQAKELRELSRQAQKRRAAKHRDRYLLEREQREAKVEHEAKLIREKKLATWRRERYLAEQRFWNDVERPVKSCEAWGDDVLVYIEQTTPVRWNEYPATGSIDVAAGETWKVSRFLADRLVQLGRAALL